MTGDPRFGVPGIGTPGTMQPAYSGPVAAINPLPVQPLGGSVTDQPYGGGAVAVVRGGSVSANSVTGTIVRH
jgi:hypothetical protein